MSKLAAGCAARIFKVVEGGGRVLDSQIDTGSGGGVDVRHLAAGSYVVVDEHETEHEFEVGLHVESVEIPVEGRRAPRPSEPDPIPNSPNDPVPAKAQAKRTRKAPTAAQKAARRKRDAERKAKAKK